MRNCVSKLRESGHQIFLEGFQNFLDQKCRQNLSRKAGSGVSRALRDSMFFDVAKILVAKVHLFIPKCTVYFFI